MMESILVKSYDPAWPNWFQHLRDQIWPALEDIALSIEHVGSTAVPGLAAKPVIDVDIVIRTVDDLPAIVQRLGALGYEARGNLGIEGREAFRAEPNPVIAHHLYVCAVDSLPLRNHLILRDYLRSHPADAAAYGALKEKLAQQFPREIDKYIEGKSNFILEMLRLGGLSSEELATISAENGSASSRAR